VRPRLLWAHSRPTIGAPVNRCHAALDPHSAHTHARSPSGKTGHVVSSSPTVVFSTSRLARVFWALPASSIFVLLARVCFSHSALEKLPVPLLLVATSPFAQELRVPHQNASLRN